MKRTILLGCILLVVSTSGRSAEIGVDGGISLTVSFEVDEDLSKSVMPPLGDPNAEAHY